MVSNGSVHMGRQVQVGGWAIVQLAGCHVIGFRYLPLLRAPSKAWAQGFPCVRNDPHCRGKAMFFMRLEEVCVMMGSAKNRLWGL